MRLVAGVGLNDAGYNVTNHVGKKLVWVCPVYRMWTSMLVRCYSTKYQAQKPTYVGCSVDTDWHRFSAFRAWLIPQQWEGKQLDKDLILQGNKVYSADTCCLVDGRLNRFLTDSAAARGEYPAGVSLHKRTGKAQARCGDPQTAKDEYLGLFADPNEAHLSWAARKLEHAKILAAQQTDPRVAGALVGRFTAKYEAALDTLTTVA